MIKLITVCTCGFCKDRLEMDSETSEKGRGIRIFNKDAENYESIIVPESLALVIEKWMEENKGELAYDE